MKARNSIIIDLESFGSEFANMDSEDQAKFFIGLANELSKWPSVSQTQMQFAYAADKLDDKQKNTLDLSLGMLWFKDNTR
jgi:hypothetical protein